jgi:hypothetical protein
MNRIPALFVLPFLLASPAGAEGIMMPGTGPEPRPVLPASDHRDEITDSFNDRVANLVNTLDAEQKNGNLSPEQYEEDTRVVKQALDGIRRFRETHGGSVLNDQIDTGKLEQVAQQLDRSSVD